MKKILLLSSILSLSLSNAFGANGEKVNPESWQNSKIVIDKATKDKILFLSRGDSLITQMPIKDNGEKMINMKEKQTPRLKLITTIPGYEKFLAWPMNEVRGIKKGAHNNVREGLYNKLVTMLDYLPENIGIAFVFGYHSTERIQEIFEYTLLENQQRYPNPEINYNETVKAFGDIKNNVTSTGGRIGITLFDVATNQILDLGKLGLDVDDNSFEFFSSNITDEQKTNRKIMADAASKAGFVLYGESWYALSYGDQVWAYINGKQEAIYGLATKEDREFQPEAKEDWIASLMSKTSKTANAKQCESDEADDD